MVPDDDASGAAISDAIRDASDDAISDASDDASLDAGRKIRTGASEIGAHPYSVQAEVTNPSTLHPPPSTLHLLPIPLPNRPKLIPLRPLGER